MSEYSTREDYDYPDYPAPRYARPHPGLAAVLSVVVPGLGQVYNGRLGPGLVWFLAVGFGYWAVLVPGFLLHAICVYCAFAGARGWRGY